MAREWILEEGEKAYNIRHRCFQLARSVILFVNEFKYPFVLRSLFDQLIRSVSSIGANAVEGSSGSSKKDFINFYSIALKSANETKYWLCLIRDTTECNKQEINSLLKEADEISKIIASIIRTAKV